MVRARQEITRRCRLKEPGSDSRCKIKKTAQAVALQHRQVVLGARVCGGADGFAADDGSTSRAVGIERSVETKMR
jgi:hypothetical protein